MFFLVYVSTSTRPLSPTDLRELVACSSADNARADITGMLLHGCGSFMQMLEGDQRTIFDLFHKIGDDPRHDQLKLLLQGESERRVFPGAPLGFCDLSSADARTPPGYAEFADSPLTSDEFVTDPSRARRLLQLFDTTN